VADSESEPTQDAGNPAFSEREISVLALVAKGHSNRAIGETLFISEATVKYHLHHIFQKLGVSDRTEAAVLAVKRGLIDPS
jgi:DNA-binding NarL/FixJ family response regulator